MGQGIASKLPRYNTVRMSRLRQVGTVNKLRVALCSSWLALGAGVSAGLSARAGADTARSSRRDKKYLAPENRVALW